MKLALASAAVLALVAAHPARASETDPNQITVADEPEAETVDPRVECIELKESGGANVANFHGSGAVGVLQYMPGTFFAHAAEMGHWDWSPWTPWQARLVAAHDLALGRRSQWTVGGCW